jgi:hypothetical protein
MKTSGVVMYAYVFLITVFILFSGQLPAQINIQIPESFTTHTVPDNIRGVNHPATTNMSHINSPQFINEFTKLNTGTFRWPNGSPSMNYDWKKHLSNNLEFNLKKAVQFANTLGININYSINYGTIFAPDAAEMVRTFNYNTPYYRAIRNTLLDDPEPLNITVWELGVELAHPWEWAYCWFAGNGTTPIRFRTGETSKLYPKSLTDSLYYYGGSVWREGWIPLSLGQITLEEAMLGTLKWVAQNNTDTVTVNVDYPKITADSLRVWAIDTAIDKTQILNYNEQQIYDILTDSVYRLSPGTYSLLGDTAVMIIPNTPLDSNNWVYVEYLTTGHHGAFEIRDSMLAADPDLEIGYVIDFRDTMLYFPGFTSDLQQSPPRFIIDHPYGQNTDLLLSDNLYSEIIYQGERKILKQYEPWQVQLDSLSTVLTIPRMGFGTTGWNIRLDSDNTANTSYKGILGGLYAANFLAELYEAENTGTMDLVVNNHFATIASGTNLIHLFHNNQGTLDVRPQAHAMRMVNNSIGNNIVLLDSLDIANLPDIEILDKGPGGSIDTIQIPAVKAWAGSDSTNSTFNVLLLNQDDENAYSVTLNTPAPWSCDTVYVEQLSGDLTSEIYEVTTDTIIINNDQFLVNIDSFSLMSLKIHYEELVASTTVHKMETNNNFTLHPNPTTNEVHFSTSVSEPYSIKIISMSGQLIWSKAGITGHYSFNTQFLQSGIYLVNFYPENGLTEHEKIIVE